MSATAILPNHLRPRREKVFGPARGISLDRNAKARIMVYARAWSAKHARPGQHRGQLTRAYIEVLEALLWGFHNSRDGRCFPSYEAIAAKAECCRDTVYEAIKALERADVLTWVNRIMRAPVRELDLFGKWVTRWRIIRTSNAYVFRDPLPCAQGRGSSKSENPTGTLIPDISILKKEAPTPAADLSNLSSPLLKALHSLGTAIAARDGLTVT
ncbi:MAG: helix-turn-helix domain-containing protein [Acetobacteraceae bacterium]